MEHHIGRTVDCQERLFPPIEADLYEPKDEPGDFSADQKTARKILELAHKELGSLQRSPQTGLKVLRRFGRMLDHHRMAFQAELQSQWDVADFFWKNAHNQLKSLWKNENAWSQLVSALNELTNGKFSTDPLLLRRRLLDEIMVDTHCAFFNGWVAEKPVSWPPERASYHADALAQILQLPGTSDTECTSLLTALETSQMDLSIEARNWRAGKDYARRLLARASEKDKYVEKLGEVILNEALSKLHDSTSESSNSSDAGVLDGALKEIKQVRKKYPYNPSLFQIMALTHHIRSVKLANCGRLSEALVEIERALAFSPELDQAVETRLKLTESMRELQAEMAKVQAQLAMQPGAVLSLTGSLLRAEANKGFGPALRFKESQEAKQISEEFSIAGARHLWKAMGLDEPKDRWNDRAIALTEALSQIRFDACNTTKDLTKEWDRVASMNPDIGYLDASQIVSCLVSQSQSKDTLAESQAPEPTVRYTPALKTVSRWRQPGKIPFRYWLWSTTDPRIKLQAILAIVIITVSGSLWFLEKRGRAIRQDAYHQTVQSFSTKDYVGTIKGAERFLATPLLSNRDERERTVERLYDEAFVKWFAGRVGDFSNEDRERLARYRKLRGNLRERG